MPEPSSALLPDVRPTKKACQLCCLSLFQSSKGDRFYSHMHLAVVETLNNERPQRARDSNLYKLKSFRTNHGMIIINETICSPNLAQSALAIQAFALGFRGAASR